jgi:DNA-binding transcriptional MocR family regulator
VAHTGSAPDQSHHRYEELAGFITALVDQGTLPPGARVPSLREISLEQNVSIGTALHAYRLLEDRGVIEARPQSGFFVARQRAANELRVPGMSKPSRKPERIAVSAIMHDLLRYAADPAFVPLGCAVPSPEILAAKKLDRSLARIARAEGVRRNVYTDCKGDARLRQEIARRALHWGQAISPEDIAITCGCTEALMLALKAVARPNDTIVVESPTYFGVLHALETLGLRAIELPTDPCTGIDLATLASVLSEHTVGACLFASSFNNPLGCTMPDDKKIDVLRLLAKHRVPLIEDDIYGDIYFGAERPRPFMSLDRAGNTIYCSSFSKTVAPGYRIGWIVAGRHMQEILKQKFSTTLCGPALTQAAFAEFLSTGYDHHLRRIRSLVADNIAHLLTAIASAFPKETKVSRPAGGFVLWLELPKPVDTRKLFEDALAENICFAPGDVFSATSRYSNCLRLSAGYPWSQRLERGVWKLGEMASAALR